MGIYDHVRPHSAGGGADQHVHHRLAKWIRVVRQCCGARRYSRHCWVSLFQRVSLVVSLINLMTQRLPQCRYSSSYVRDRQLERGHYGVSRPPSHLGPESRLTRSSDHSARILNPKWFKDNYDLESNLPLVTKPRTLSTVDDVWAAVRDLAEMRQKISLTYGAIYETEAYLQGVDPLYTRDARFMKDLRLHLSRPTCPGEPF